MSNQTRLPRLINVNGVSSIRSNDLAQASYMLAQPLFCKIAEHFQSEHLTKVKRAYTKDFIRMPQRINSLEVQYAC